ncbi:XRE family transcriptional regulator [Deinococcus hopiensis]|uniref:Predicted transcriptional regulator with C-terminal CBS domains n=1 Tax=Deinococcus hopiensis KR-140 TaxID=695939 RepID=A0A1W1UZK9_9DEIO|nr:XRE family transcriptional regulator [Deinococcus hopiensis]SMB86516.1 Predicted transcriptional regulator with C-terminal CBS domains [Deinococcus hopiensis KR-140]
MHKITEVTPGEGLTLHLTYADGATIHADVSGLLAGDPGVFAPLADRAFFEGVQLGRRGRIVTWPGELDLDADVFRMEDGDPDKPGEFRTLSSTPPMPADPVSLEVARVLDASGLTQSEAAARAGMQQPNVARLLDPQYHGHSLSTLRRLAEALGYDVEVKLVPRQQDRAS